MRVTLKRKKRSKKKIEDNSEMMKKWDTTAATGLKGEKGKIVRGMPEKSERGEGKSEMRWITMVR